MSGERASELLKALTPHEADLLEDALPEIIAVVEAAEELHELVETEESVGNCLISRAESLIAGASIEALRAKLSGEGQ